MLGPKPGRLSVEEQVRVSIRARVCEGCRRADDEVLGAFAVAEPVRCQRGGESVTRGIVVMLASPTGGWGRRGRKKKAGSGAEVTR